MQEMKDKREKKMISWLFRGLVLSTIGAVVVFGVSQGVLAGIGGGAFAFVGGLLVILGAGFVAGFVVTMSSHLMRKR